MNSTGIEHLLKHFSCAVTPYSWDQISDIKLFGLFFRDLFPCASISLQVQLIIVLHRKIWIKFRNAIYVRQLKWIEFDSFSVFFLSFHPAIYIRDNDSAIICCFITVTVSFVLQIASRAQRFTFTLHHNSPVCNNFMHWCIHPYTSRPYGQSTEMESLTSDKWCVTMNRICRKCISKVLRFVAGRLSLFIFLKCVT